MKDDNFRKLWPNIVVRLNVDTDLDELVRKYHRSRGQRIAAAYEDYNGIHIGYLKAREVAEWFGVTPGVVLDHHRMINNKLTRRKRKKPKQVA